MKSIKKVAEDLNTKAGKTLAFVGDRGQVESISTGILPLDAVIGIGGLPKGRIIEVHGIFSSAKTSLCLAIVSAFQRQGLKCTYVDSEYSFSNEHAKSFGVNTDELLILQPDCGEEAFELMESLVREKQADLIVVDSVSALVPRPDAEAEHGKAMIGNQAKLISKGLSKLVGPINKSGTIIIFINQLRMNIMGGQYDPYTLPGGLALRFYSSVMLELHRRNALVQGEKQIGVEIEIKVKKNKVGIPNEKCLIQLMFNQGFSAGFDLLSMAEKMGHVKVEGKTYFFGDVKLGVGLKRSKTFLEDNPELMAKIKEKLGV